MSAIAGILLLAATLAELGRGSFGFYEDFYAMPLEKYDVLTPLRWEDAVVLIVFYLLCAGLLYLSYRLLKYSSRGRSSRAAS